MNVKRNKVVSKVVNMIVMRFEDSQCQRKTKNCRHVGFLLYTRLVFAASHGVVCRKSIISEFIVKVMS